MWKHVCWILGGWCCLGSLCFLVPQQANGAVFWAGQTLIRERFDHGLKNWWVEGGRKVEVKQKRLFVDTDPLDGERQGVGCTVWCRRELPPGDVKIEFDAHVVSSSRNANNINFFLCYSDPLGRSLFASRKDRSDGAYKKYHQLNGYIVTFLRDWRSEGGKNPDGSAKARIRIRRCPGFKLLAETYTSRCEAGHTYHICITKRGGRIEFAVDGNTLLQADDPQPHEGGLIGLRTWRTRLWWDNVKVTLLDGPYRRPTQVWPTLIQNPLESPEPDGRRVVFINPPTFRWPVDKNVKAPFSVWLATRPDFSDARRLGSTSRTFFRPLQPLLPGRYYWYVTDSRERKLLPTASFELSRQTRRWPLLPWKKAFGEIPKTHPRLFVRPEWLPKLRQTIQRPELKPLVDYWKRDARRAMQAKLPDLSTYEEEAKPDAGGHHLPPQTAAKYFAARLTSPVPVLCVLYTLTGEDAYVKEVRRRVEVMLKLDPNGFTSHRRADFANGQIVFALAWAYDYLHEQWSSEFRGRIRRVLLQRMANTFKAYQRRLEQKVFAPHGWQHVLQHNTAGALALYDESELARQWFEWSAQMHVALYPWFGGPDGGSNEGFNYYLSTNMLSSIYAAELFRAATNGLINLFDNPWYHGTPYYLFYCGGLGPNRSQFGDHQWPFNHPLRLTAALAAAYWATEFRDSYVTTYYNLLGQKLNHFRLFAGGGPVGMCLLEKWPLKFPKPRSLASLPPARHFRGIGVVAMRSHPTDPVNEIYFEFRSSAYGSYGHSHADQNSFNVSAFGEPLIVDAGYYHSYGDAHHYGYTVTTAAHNTILIDGKGQGSRTVAAYGRITDFQIGQGWVRVTGDAAHAYLEIPVKQFKRHVLWLEPDTFLIVDELETPSPHMFQWLLHSAERMRLDEQTVWLNVGKAAARLTLLHPSDLKFQQTNRFPVPVKVWRPDKMKNQFPPQWHLTASTSCPTKRVRFVAVLQVCRSGKESRLPKPEVQWNDSTVSIRLPDGRHGNIQLVRQQPQTQRR